MAIASVLADKANMSGETAVPGGLVRPRRGDRYK